MKTLKSVLIVLSCCLPLAWGCQDNNETPLGNVNDLSPFAKEFLGMRNGSVNSLAAAGTQMVNKGFQGAMNTFLSMTGATGVPSDSTIVDPGPGGWTTCGTITETQNPDGSTTVVTDYGAGCEEGFGEYKYLMFGKNSSTYRYLSSQTGSAFTFEYFSRYLADHFGSTYYYDINNDGTKDTTTWISNGHSSYSGKSMYDTVTHKFSGYYAYSDTSEYTYDDETYNSMSQGESIYDNLQSVTTKNNYEYRQGEEFYRSEVMAPLVTNYTCLTPASGPEIAICPMWLVYVSGRERVTYNQAGKSGQFEIDYGNGECDNIIYIYENGKVIKIDLSREIGILMKGG